MIGVGEIGERFVNYAAIAAVSIEPGTGALRLYRRHEKGLRRRLRWLRMDIYHPAGEWKACDLRPDGECNVELWSLEELQREMNEIRAQRRDAARLMRLDGWREDGWREI